MRPKKENDGCGCASVPFSLILVLLGVGYWGFTHLDKVNIGKFLPEDISKFLPDNQQLATPNNQQPTPPNLTPARTQRLPGANSPLEPVFPTETPTTNPQVSPLPVTSKT